MKALYTLPLFFLLLLPSCRPSSKQSHIEQRTSSYNISYLNQRFNTMETKMAELQKQLNEITLLIQQEQSKKKHVEVIENKKYFTKAPAPITKSYQVERIEPPRKALVVKPTYHTIRKGDTYSKLATKYSVSLRSIMNANPSTPATRLRIGKKVKIPLKTAQANSNYRQTTSQNTYTRKALPEYKKLVRLKARRPLEDVAKHFNTDVNTLNRLNRFQRNSNDMILAGEVIYVPVHGGA